MYVHSLSSLLVYTADGLPPTQATVQAHEEFELITDAFNEIWVHLQVVEIVAAHPGRLLYDTSLELLVKHRATERDRVSLAAWPRRW